MRYRYLDDFRRGISVSAIFSYGIAVLGTPQCHPQQEYLPCAANTLCIGFSSLRSIVALSGALLSGKATKTRALRTSGETPISSRTRGFSARARLNYLAFPTKTAMLRRLSV